MPCQGHVAFSFLTNYQFKEKLFVLTLGGNRDVILLNECEQLKSFLPSFVPRNFEINSRQSVCKESAIQLATALKMPAEKFQ